MSEVNFLNNIQLFGMGHAQITAITCVANLEKKKKSNSKSKNKINEIPSESHYSVREVAAAAAAVATAVL